MATNPYFNHYHYTPEQDLINEINQEIIQIYGMDITYLPRSLEKEDPIFGEDVLSKFESYFNIEMYMENVDGFEGDGTFLSKFGITISEQATFVVSKQRFEDELRIAGLLTERTRPTEGDLLFFPLTNGLFEIKFVEHEDPFHQAGGEYVYKLKVELFHYSHEQINTGITEIDQIQTQYGHSITISLGAGSGTFQVGETAYQGVNLLSATSSATVIGWDSGTKILQLQNITGTIDTTENIIGDTSTAEYAITAITNAHASDPLADNTDIETQATSLIDFSEKDPFSEGDY